ncbi:MAG: radical SAM protein [Oligoflexia bacterium]|nr:radical SAM protein [Oligoflexia bacterium]
MLETNHTEKQNQDLSLKINEIFYSIQGESTLAGWPTVFVRTTGCNIRCNYCDTKYSYYEGTEFLLSQLETKIKSYKAQHVCITGGEPMAQKNILPLMKNLCDQGYTVSLETNGYYDTTQVDSRVIKVIDIKTPDSDAGNSFNFKNLEALNPQDQIKFVLCSENDYEWAKQLISEKSLEKKCTVFMSPAFETMSNKSLAEKILSDSLHVRLQLQLHKYIWNPNTRGV